MPTASKPVAYAKKPLNERRLIRMQVAGRIAKLMDGREWDADLCSEIAEVLEDAGYQVRDTAEMEQEADDAE